MSTQNLDARGYDQIPLEELLKIKKNNLLQLSTALAKTNPLLSLHLWKHVGCLVNQEQKSYSSNQDNSYSTNVLIQWSEFSEFLPYLNEGLDALLKLNWEQETSKAQNTTTQTKESQNYSENKKEQAIYPFAKRQHSSNKFDLKNVECFDINAFSNIIISNLIKIGIPKTQMPLWIEKLQSIHQKFAQEHRPTIALKESNIKKLIYFDYFEAISLLQQKRSLKMTFNQETSSQHLVIKSIFEQIWHRDAKDIQSNEYVCGNSAFFKQTQTFRKKENCIYTESFCSKERKIEVCANQKIEFKKDPYSSRLNQPLSEFDFIDSMDVLDLIALKPKEEQLKYLAILFDQPPLQLSNYQENIANQNKETPITKEKEKNNDDAPIAPNPIFKNNLYFEDFLCKLTRINSLLKLDDEFFVNKWLDVYGNYVKKNSIQFKDIQHHNQKDLILFLCECLSTNNHNLIDKTIQLFFQMGAMKKNAKNQAISLLNTTPIELAIGVGNIDLALKWLKEEKTFNARSDIKIELPLNEWNIDDNNTVPFSIKQNKALENTSSKNKNSRIIIINISNKYEYISNVRTPSIKITFKHLDQRLKENLDVHKQNIILPVLASAIFSNDELLEHVCKNKQLSKQIEKQIEEDFPKNLEKELAACQYKLLNTSISTHKSKKTAKITVQKSPPENTRKTSKRI